MHKLVAGLFAVMTAASSLAADPAAQSHCAHAHLAALAMPDGGLPVHTSQGTATLAIARPADGPRPDATAAAPHFPQLVLRLEPATAPQAKGSPALVRGIRQPLFSSLVTPGLPSVVPHVARLGATEVAAFIHEAGDPVLLAVVLTETDGSGNPVTTLHLGSGDEGMDSALLTVAALEHLYAYLSRLPPQNAFRLGGESRVRAQGDALSWLAGRRQCAAHQLSAQGIAAKIRPWHTVALQPKVPDLEPAGDGHMVAVRLQGEMRSVEGSTITFTRDPHLVCFAQVDAQGTAACRLTDAHFHEHRHNNEGEETVATFGGAMTDEATYLPTTATWSNPRRAFSNRIDPGWPLRQPR